MPRSRGTELGSGIQQGNVPDMKNAILEGDQKDRVTKAPRWSGAESCSSLGNLALLCETEQVSLDPDGLETHNSRGFRKKL